ncbi:MAG: DUF5017 domain-containing protein [Bacteroidota bacterium]|nr:DUF5017 domain-containing protein [Bacteroidota bacterium]
MKKHILFSIITFSFTLAFVNCSRMEIEAPDGFSAVPTDSVFTVGDTVKFNLTGSPDQVEFFSGEPGMNYANINRTSDGSGYAKLVFQTSLQQGVLTNGDSLQLLISTNLNGYDKNSVANATWTDITSRNTKWPSKVSTSFTTSDSVNLSDFINADSVNIAFRYKGKKSASAQQKWKIQGFSLVHNLPDGTKTGLFAGPQISSGYATSAFAYTGWVQVSFKNDTTTGYNVWNVGTAGFSSASSVKTANGVSITNVYPLVFDPGTSTNDEENDDWVITSKVSLKQVKPDMGNNIKNQMGVTLTSFNALPTFYYKAPGTYTATFVAINRDVDKSCQTIRQVQVKILPKSK